MFSVIGSKRKIPEWSLCFHLLYMHDNLYDKILRRGQCCGMASSISVCDISIPQGCQMESQLLHFSPVPNCSSRWSCHVEDMDESPDIEWSNPGHLWSKSVDGRFSLPLSNFLSVSSLIQHFQSSNQSF